MDQSPIGSHDRDQGPYEIDWCRRKVDPVIEGFETHISTVVFVGDRALKFMKPVKTAFLDQSTVALRRAACERELWLNRRIAPDVYLGIGTVSEDDEVVDHFLVMRRLPVDRRLSVLASTIEIHDAVRRVAKTVAAFHARQPVTAAARAAGTAAGVWKLWRSNLDEIEHLADTLIDRDTVARVRDLADRYIDGRHPLFEARGTAGFCRDGHGDLLADDIFMLPDGPRILDCLAFDETLRTGDVLLDIAFLAMDLERLGRPDAADEFIAAYDEYSNERHPKSLLDFYVAYRALVRAKIGCLRAQQTGSPDDAGRVSMMLDLCLRHLRAAQPAIVLVGGRPGTGKSTLANGLAERQGWAALSSDLLRREMIGVAHDEHSFAAPEEGIYAPEITHRVYGQMLRRAERLLERGESVVLDASWTSAGERARARSIAFDNHARLVEIECVLDESLAKERIERRLATMFDPSDATVEIYDHLAARADAWPQAVQLDTSGTLGASVDAAQRAVQTAVSGTITTGTFE